MPPEDNNIEDIDSPQKIQARKETSEKEREELENDFLKNVDNSIIKNTDELWLKDKDNITSRLITEYWKEKENFDYFDSLEKIIKSPDLSLTVWPQTPEKWENYNNFKEKIIDFKEELYDKIISEENIITDNTEIHENQEEVPESAEPIVEKTTWNVKDILDNPKNQENIIENENKWWVEWVKDKIQSNLDLEPNQLKEKLNNKKENISNAKEIFFSKEKLWEYSQNLQSETSNTESLKELWESLIQWEKIVDEDLVNILWNFVIETWEENISDYALENPEAVDEALNNAFELQIELVKDWKVNYRTETVENLKNEILDNDLTNPLEKLEKFKQLKAEVNTSIWSIAKKREKSTTWTEKQKLQEKQKQLQTKYKKLNKNPEQNKDKIKEIIEEAKNIEKQLKEKPKSGEVMSWNKTDKIQEKTPDFLRENS